MILSIIIKIIIGIVRGILSASQARQQMAMALVYPRLGQCICFRSSDRRRDL